MVPRRLAAVGLGVILAGVACRPQPVPVGSTDTAPAAGPRAPTPGSSPTASVPPRPTGPAIAIADLYHLRSVNDVQLSPDGARIAFTVQYSDRVGAPYTRIWLVDARGGEPTPLAGETEGSNPRWSPDGTRLAWLGSVAGSRQGVVVGRADGAGATLVAEVMTSNHPLPNVGERLAWAPDGRRVAYVSAMRGPEPDMEGDPIVITRYWFRPATSAGGRFSDNRRLHLFVADVETKQVRQLTEGTNDEHSIDWSPDGRSLVFLSNREPDPDFVNNYDLFVIDVEGGAPRRLTTTRSNEYRPVWSPDGRTIAYQGLKRPLTSSETNMEDTHVWTIDVASGARTEVGASTDNRQGPPRWSADGRALYATVQARGAVHLFRFSPTGQPAEAVALGLEPRVQVGAFSVGKDALALSVTAPTSPAELFVARAGAASRLTKLNDSILGQRRLADVEAFTFPSFDGLEVEAFLTRPTRIDGATKHPLIVMIHGGPHSQQGPGFNHRAQAYAARGWGALMVNYRGSTGYGQGFANAIARDQNGAEARDVLAAVDAALARYPWLDPDRLGVEGQSYGGQLSNWLVTQTDRFKAAVPAASISNLVSHNYMSVYHDYLEQEYGAKPHHDGIVDLLWERSAIRYVHRVKTPVMFIHGDNDQLVNPAEIEQFFIALKDVGVETVMVRYPREGHGMRESGHVADTIERSMAWYSRHFERAAPRTSTH